MLINSRVGTPPPGPPATLPPTLPPPIPPTPFPGITPSPSIGYLQSKANNLFVVITANQNLAATQATTSTATVFKFAGITGGYVNTTLTIIHTNFSIGLAFKSKPTSNSFPRITLELTLLLLTADLLLDGKRI